MHIYEYAVHFRIAEEDQNLNWIFVAYRYSTSFALGIQLVASSSTWYVFSDFGANLGKPSTANIYCNVVYTYKLREAGIDFENAVSSFEPGGWPNEYERCVVLVCP